MENPFNEYSRLKTESEALLTAQSRLPYTVARHVTNILNKIGCKNRAEAATYAAQHGLLTD
ncbi:MAG: DNA-binding response regulator [Chloroflexi bacterium]|nr:MAG: DNA-binding response regulator [Chloroflexota bacterium]